MTDDVLASGRVNELRETVKSWAREEGLSTWDRREQTGLLRNLVVREGRRTGQLQARLVTSRGDFRAAEFAAAVPADSVLWTRAAGVAETTRDGETELLKGSAKLEEELSGLRFRISPDAFFQTNTEMAERLYRSAAHLAGLERPGAGARPLLRHRHDRAGAGARRRRGLGRGAHGGGGGGRHRERTPERHRQRAVLRRRRAHGNAPAARALRQARRGGGGPAPAGLSQKVVRRLLEAEAERVVYVSCNPTTLAPNARQMADAGYVLETVRPVDMFPQTPHIECVALLRRAGR